MMSTFKERLQRLLRLKTPPHAAPSATAARAPQLSSSVVTHEHLDDSALAGIRGRAARLQAVFDDPPLVRADPQAADTDGEGYAGWEDLVSDLFRAFHTLKEPALVGEEDVLPSRLRHRQVMRRILDSPELVKTRAHSRLDPVVSAMATMQSAETLREAFTQTQQEDLALSQQLARLEHEAQQALSEQQHPGAEGDGGQPAGGEDEQAGRAQELADQLDKALADIEDIAREQERDSTVERQIGQAVRSAMEKAEQASQSASLLPGAGGPNTEQLDPERALALAERVHNSPVLAQILALAGRLERDMRGARAKKVTGARGELVGITLTGDPAKALPRELALLRHPVLRRESYRRIAERRLFAYRTNGKAQGARGPVGVIRDGSESMRGQRIVWAAAVSLAIVLGAHRERRNAFVVEYGSGGVLCDWEFPHGRSTPEGLLDMAAHFFDSGTDISQGVARGREIIRTRRPFSTADLVLITDGEDTWQEHDQVIHDQLVEDTVRIHGIAVAHFPNAYLRRMCDGRVERVDQLDGPSEPLRNLAQSIT
jgi:uncharacterized protein with von Willebrand factor type A (vWA) domain